MWRRKDRRTVVCPNREHDQEHKSEARVELSARQPTLSFFMSLRAPSTSKEDHAEKGMEAHGANSQCRQDNRDTYIPHAEHESYTDVSAQQENGIDHLPHRPGFVELVQEPVDVQECCRLSHFPPKIGIGGCRSVSASVLEKKTRQREGESTGGAGARAETGRTPTHEEWREVRHTRRSLPESIAESVPHAHRRKVLREPPRTH